MPFLRPDADSADGNWTTDAGGSILYAAVDETSASDTDYIQSGANPSQDIVKLSLSNPSGDVDTSQAVTIRYRYAKTGAEQMDVKVRLVETSTTIAEWTHTDVGTGWTTAAQVLTTEQKAAITNWDNLFLEIEAGAILDAYAVGGNSPEVVVDFKNEYYRKAGVDSTFSGVLSYTGTSLRTMVDSSGSLVWAPHNLIYPSNPDGWIANTGSYTAGQSDPDGGSNATLIVSQNAAYVLNTGVLSQNNVTYAPNATYTIAAIMKAGAADYGAIGLSNWAGYTTTAAFNLASGTVGSFGTHPSVSDNLSTSIESLGDGWYLCKLTFRCLIAMSALHIASSTVDASGTYNRQVTGDGTSGVYIYAVHVYRSDLGGMVDNPDRGDSYVPTTDSAVYLPARGHHVYNGSSWVNEGMLLETEARTNLLLNSDTLSTQDVTVTAVAHTLHFTGTGTITLSGASTAGPLVGTGTGENNRVSLTFTPSAGTLTCTVTGTVTNAQLEVGSTPSSYIPTSGATVTRAAESLKIPAANMSYSTTGLTFDLKGNITHFDDASQTSFNIYNWYVDGTEFFSAKLRTVSSFVGQPQVEQRNSGEIRTQQGGIEVTPAINAPIHIGTRHTDTEMAVAQAGTITSPVTYNNGIASVASADFEFFAKGALIIGQFRHWDIDLGATDLAAATDTLT